MGMPPCHGNNKGLLPLVAINSKGYATGLLYPLARAENFYRMRVSTAGR